MWYRVSGTKPEPWAVFCIIEWQLSNRFVCSTVYTYFLLHSRWDGRGVHFQLAPPPQQPPTIADSASTIKPAHNRKVKHWAKQISGVGGIMHTYCHHTVLSRGCVCVCKRALKTIENFRCTVRYSQVDLLDLKVSTLCFRPAVKNDCNLCNFLLEKVCPEVKGNEIWLHLIIIKT